VVVAAAGAAVTLLSSLDHWITAAKWAKWLIANWNALTKGIWSTLLWFVPNLSQLDANLLTIICFVLATIFSSMRRREPAIPRRTLHFVSAAVAGFAIAAIFARNTLTIYEHEDDAVLDHALAMLVASAPSAAHEKATAPISKPPTDFGYYSVAVHKLARVIQDHHPYHSCAKSALTKIFKKLNAKGLDPARAPSREILAVMSEPELAESMRCIHADQRWLLTFSPLIANTTASLLLIALVGAAVWLVSKAIGIAPKADLISVRLWATLAILATILALNYGSLAIEPWLTNNGISLPS
jgi:hypothetical protein